ncbi:MAG: NitT/TauT family transport system ATP-binding protein [Phormidesmis priestleyi Ana]|uniref:NitT/TauT family transport system ATP-binding protein n=1 Tax=Phormidesmis priestleyi Ana TaxID=1666911 RepID=A0A0P8C0P9_9CYAN|nr:MAG: NitT/TauT family transport system ATP-binding protein [Phormidesmis priestleyi Ana]
MAEQISLTALGSKQPLQQSSSETSADLTFQDVSLQYRMSGHPMQVIKQVSLTVAPSEFVSIVGPSGCGKTSLLRMISGLNPAHSGQVCFRGEPITKPLSNVGIAFQNPVLLPWRTTLQNVLLPLEVIPTHKRQIKTHRDRYERMAQDLLTTVGLEDFKNHYPQQLSGGMKQRASLCRALIHQPELLLLDEPFAALDAFTREEMWELLQRLWERSQCTSVLVTHNLREAIFLSDTVYVMGPRPSQIVHTLKVDLPRPRTLDMCFTESFHQMYSELRRHIQRK